MQIIKNKNITVNINPKGAELTSVFDSHMQTEYMWSANPDFWAKSSPILFPIVGSLKDNTYFFEGKKYNLPRHGFAREKTFLVEKTTENSVTFLLTEDENSLKNYPFKFELRVFYLLENNKLSLTYLVKNSGVNNLYFSVGGHPAFAVPLVQNTDFDAYYLEFNKTENFKRWGLTSEGLVETEPTDFLKDTNIISLTKKLFYGDALVFKNLKSSTITLKSKKTERELKFNFGEFDYLGIWSSKNADFVCIEPWCGIADAANHNQELTQKEGIRKLNPNEVFEKTWSIEIF
jgi:galactose mutarotase-like enzyme